MSYDFYKHMLDRRGMRFVCSTLIWQEAVTFWNTRNYSLPGRRELDQFFDFPEQKLDAHLAELMGGLLSRRQANAVGLLWGLPYVYEFLLAKEIISEPFYQEVLSRPDSLKAKVIAAFPHHLWKYDFVHRWVPPGETPAAEAALFAASFTAVRPQDYAGADDFYDCEETEGPEAPAPFLPFGLGQPDVAFDRPEVADTGGGSVHRYAHGLHQEEVQTESEGQTAEERQTQKEEAVGCQRQDCF